MRREFPIAILDPFLLGIVGGRMHVMASPLEVERIAAAAPDAVLHDLASLGLHELLESGLDWHELDLELASRAAAAMGVPKAVVDPDMPVAVAERLRADGMVLHPDPRAIASRRRVKSAAELAASAARRPPPRPACVPQQPSCARRLPREVSEAVRAQAELVRQALESARAAVRPGVSGRELNDITCDLFEAAGFRTQRTGPDDSDPDEGFQFFLGHGVGLRVHEDPGLGRVGDAPLVAGDVIALEPGLRQSEIGGVRIEDLLLVTAEGSETLTDYPYDLAP
jgi:hypothetical protein